MHPQHDPKQEFVSTFKTTPHGMVKAPGRVCVLGEHADYNHGFVIPFGLDLTTVVTFRVRNDSYVRVHSLEYPDYEDLFDLSKEVTPCKQSWANYVRGVFYITRDYGFNLQQGLDLLISSTLPHDAGLASSGAMSAAVAGTIRKVFNLPLDKRSLALIAEKAENDFFGRQCGIMDPLTAVFAKDDYLLLIDCESFNIEQIPFPEGWVVIIFHSRARKKLAGTEFNDLRKSCNEAVRTMNVKSLRHASLDLLNKFRNDMGSMAYHRAYHIITENERTQRLAQAFTNSDLRLACRLMSESHESLKRNFGNTIPEIDALVDFCQQELKDKIGARMTGGGFGGSVIALCEDKYAHQVIKNVSSKYFDRFGINMFTHVCRPADGIRISWNKETF
jgi:galactokinase